MYSFSLGDNPVKKTELRIEQFCKLWTIPALAATLTLSSFAIVALTPNLAYGGEDRAVKYTGCLKPNGKILWVREGNSASRPCKRKWTEISFYNSARTEALQEDLSKLSSRVAALEFGSEAETSQVKITNDRNESIFVRFSSQDGSPGPITWEFNDDCKPAGPENKAAGINPGATCSAMVDANAGSTRFCAAKNSAPENCWEAQQNHQTMVETTFESASNPGCFGKGNCVWFDISVIPSFCTDDKWKLNQCAGTGGASYNLPVSLGCGPVDEADKDTHTYTYTYTCKGPTSERWGPENYPDDCGDPDATRAGGKGNVNAYFYPMFEPPENKYQPSSVCLKKQSWPLKIKWEAGD